MTHVEALELDRLPEHLVVLGGGFVSLELAQAMRRFGSRVTIIERGSQLVAREDGDVTEAISQLFQDEGIEMLFNTELLGVEGSSGHGIRARRESARWRAPIFWLQSDAFRTRKVSGLRRPVELDERGYIRVNERLQTSAPGIWAMGEGAGSPQFTHVATDDFRIVRDNLNGGNRTTRDRLIPFCIFTDPELARVGLNESQAQKQGIPYRLAKIPMAKVRRAHTLSETRGFLKALVGAETDEILGFTAFGTEAGEIMSVVQTAMLAKLPYTSLRDAILAHPTMAEGLTVLFDAVPARSTARTTLYRHEEREGQAAA
jgi:pyruvate/2-oxoglutarate dehydrogenase complex dihydrolipoamide dehydrogenase (E3) component